MDKTQLIYIVFSAVIILALVFDLGLLSKKNQVITFKDGIDTNYFLGSFIIGVLCIYLVRKW